MSVEIRIKYKNLLESPQVGKYFENHHIVPKCLGGTDNKENIVRLTGANHLLAHYYLSCLYPEHEGLRTAFYLMCSKLQSSGEFPIEGMMEKYEESRKKHSESVSKRMSKVRGCKHYMYGKRVDNKIRAKISRSTRGSKNHRYCKEEYTFINIKTGEQFKGTKYELYTNFNLDQGNVSRMVDGKVKSVKGWKRTPNNLT